MLKEIQTILARLDASNKELKMELKKYLEGKARRTVDLRVQEKHFNESGTGIGPGHSEDKLDEMGDWY